MFLHCVALDKAEVAVPWRKFERGAISLFWFRLGLGLVGLAGCVPLLAVMALTGWRMLDRAEADINGIIVAGRRRADFGVDRSRIRRNRKADY